MRRPSRNRSRWPPPRSGSLDVTCPAPSCLPGHAFTLTLTGTWEELPSPHPHHSPGAAATDHALTFARDITSGYITTESEPAAARINTLLGRPVELPHLPVRIVWATAHLTAGPEAQRAAVDQERRAHEQQQRRAEHDRRLDQAHVLRDTLMSDPSLALAYWFAAAPHTIDKNTLTRLEELFSTAAAYAPNGTWAPLARLLHTFTGQLSDDAKRHLLDTLAALTDRYGQADIAAAIRALRITPNGSDLP
ncbi:hypothetical protein OG275_00160 [Streptomyces niveus]|uniref:hypothetical protein n=1 Tax=Streptomyces niveus TaxID=193462 RepID=UPI002E31B657|nr:hypothetical protein [Streptomyces niveus]